MRNVLKAETLERRFPLSVENGCIVSKDDLTVAFEGTAWNPYTVSLVDEYEAMHSSWIKAVKVLPEHSVVCKQDWFIKETYRPKTDDGEQSFLTRSYELHFNERPYPESPQIPVPGRRPPVNATAGKVTSAPSAGDSCCPGRLPTRTWRPAFWKRWSSSSIS